MRITRRVRIVCLVAGAAAVLVAGTVGVTYAATVAAKPSTYAVACTNSAAGLRLISHGKCPKGDAPIRLAAAPTPLAVTGTRAARTVKIGTFSFTAACTNDMGGEHATLTMTSARQYDVQGSYVFDSHNSGGLATPNGYAEDGAGQISYTASGNALSSSFKLDNNAGVTGTFEIIQSGHTMTATFGIFAFGVECSVQAQLAPSS